jgi:hypothetical protein
MCGAMELKYYAEKAINTANFSDSEQPEAVALNPGGVRE